MYKYELRIDGDGNKCLFCDSILSPGQIDNIILGKRRKKYSVNDEFKMNRQAKTTTEWKEYDTYMELCSEKGREMKLQAIAEKAAWKDHQRKSYENEKDFIERLKKAGLVIKDG